MKMGRVHLIWLPAVVALTTTGCDLDEQPQPEYVGVCVDQVTEVRLSDDQCGEPDDEGRTTSGSYFIWIHSSSASTIPAIGQHTSSYLGSRTVPRGAAVARGVPSGGGAVSSVVRGGLGVRAGTSGSSGS